VSKDREESSFNSYFGAMPWLALPYSAHAKRQELSNTFSVRGIPTLVVLDGSAKLLTDKGTLKVKQDPTGASWLPKANRSSTPMKPEQPTVAKAAAPPVLKRTISNVPNNFRAQYGEDAFMALARCAFNDSDADGSGAIDARELLPTLRKCGMKVADEAAAAAVLRQYDTNANGLLELSEWLGLVNDLIDGSVQAKEGRAAAASVQAKEARGVAARPQRGAGAGGGGQEPSEEWRQATLDAHNQLRALHSAPPLEWSQDCYEAAKRAAEHCSRIGKLEHQNLGGKLGRHGQNLAWCSMSPYPPEDAVNAWYDEIDDPGYDFSKPGNQPGCGHFTALVWTATTHAGTARSDCGCYVATNYYPGGNVTMNGRPLHGEHVLPPRGRRTRRIPKYLQRPGFGMPYDDDDW